MAKKESKFAKELERLQRRLQTCKKSLQLTEIKAEDLDASIQAARLATAARKPKWAK